jgi:hypothetical protein
MIGYHSSLWLVVVLLALTAGLAAAVWSATRGRTPTPARPRRPR